MDKFMRMMDGKQDIESNLHRHLTEHLNAEIVLRTITDLDVAMRWLSSTFLHIRARENPRHYGIPIGLTSEKIDKKLLEICQIDLNKLVKTGMASMDEDTNITPTHLGILMAKYYMSFETIKLFKTVTGNEVLPHILALIARCQEFSDMRLRVDEKKCLNLLNKNKNKNSIRYPLNGKIKTSEMKINCTIQAIFGCLEIEDHSILSESPRIMKLGERITRCLIEYLEKREKCFSALLNSIILWKCFRAQLWENSAHVAKQFPGIGLVTSSQLVNAGKTSFEKIATTNPRDIEMITKKKPPFGNKIVDMANSTPKYDMNLEKLTEGEKLMLKVTLTFLNPDSLKESPVISPDSIMCLLIGDNFDNVLLYERYMHSYMLDNNQVIRFLAVDTPMNLGAELYVHFISENFVGIDIYKSIIMKDDVTGFTTPKLNKIRSKKENDVSLKRYSFKNSETIQKQTIGIISKSPKYGDDNVENNLCTLKKIVENRDFVELGNSMNKQSIACAGFSKENLLNERDKKWRIFIIYPHLRILNPSTDSLSAYRYNPTKKLSHNNQTRTPSESQSKRKKLETFNDVVSEDMMKNLDQYIESNEKDILYSKSIKWRSPLVYSPPVKYSPKISTSFSIPMPRTNGSETSHDWSSNTLETSASAKNLRSFTQGATPTSIKTNHDYKRQVQGTKFLLADEEYENEENGEDSETTCPHQAQISSKAQNLNRSLQMEDICSSSFLENLGLSRKSKRKSSTSYLNEKQLEAPQFNAGSYYRELVASKYHTQVNQQSFAQKTPRRSFFLDQNDEKIHPNELATSHIHRNTEYSKLTLRNSTVDLMPKQKSFLTQEQKHLRDNLQDPNESTLSQKLNYNENWMPINNNQIFSMPPTSKITAQRNSGTMPARLNYFTNPPEMDRQYESIASKNYSHFEQKRYINENNTPGMKKFSAPGFFEGSRQYDFNKAGFSSPKLNLQYNLLSHNHPEIRNTVAKSHVDNMCSIGNCQRIPANYGNEENIGFHWGSNQSNTDIEIRPESFKSEYFLNQLSFPYSNIGNLPVSYSERNSICSNHRLLNCGMCISLSRLSPPTIYSKSNIKYHNVSPLEHNNSYPMHQRFEATTNDDEFSQQMQREINSHHLPFSPLCEKVYQPFMNYGENINNSRAIDDRFHRDTFLFRQQNANFPHDPMSDRFFFNKGMSKSNEKPSVRNSNEQVEHKSFLLDKFFNSVDNVGNRNQD
ncbi:hypothetical protein HHI36_014859 [Cryptolaemus montrouzieri]|uniref:DNA 3'-5' helicase n=1 Tax=Cryptolaemus montrouzieri TaxID=559131 RepID=A0ABD2N484_9CUCU